MRRFQYLLVLVLLVVPLVQLSAAAGGEVAAAEGEVITIEWAGRDDAGDPVHEDNYVGQRLAEMFPDVQFVINHADIEPKEKLLVMAASGELPEFGFIAKIHALAFDFYSDGITRSIPWDMVRKRAPNLTGFLDEDPIGWITRQVPGKEEFFALASLKKYKGGSATCQRCAMTGSKNRHGAAECEGRRAGRPRSLVLGALPIRVRRCGKDTHRFSGSGSRR